MSIIFSRRVDNFFKCIFSDETLTSLPVETKLTTVGSLLAKELEPCEDLRLEGWNKNWGKTKGVISTNILWMKSPEHGMFRDGEFRNKDGVTVRRKTLKDQMLFHPPPVPVSMRAGTPSMTSFFYTDVFFWRPVGHLRCLIPCPNKTCPAPPGHLRK